MIFRTIFLLGLFLLAGGPALAQESALFGSDDEAVEEAVDEPDKPLFEKMPFDRLTLTSKYNRAVYDVLPITFAAGSRPNPLPQADSLVVRMVNMPLKELRIFWIDVERIDLFFELVEQEFTQRLDALAKDVQNLSPESDEWSTISERFELMFEYIRYLAPHRDDLPNYEKSLQKFLFEEGIYRMRSKDYPTGSARFERLYGPNEENKDYPGLEKSWAEALGLLMEEEALAGNEAKSRQFLERFRGFYPDNPIVETWEKRLRAATLQRCNQSKRAFERKEFLVAHLHFEEASKITHDLPELLEWKQKLFAEAPRLDIAVGSPQYKNTKDATAELPDWATRRARSLLARMLCEFRQPSLQGGLYAAPLGNVEKDEKGRILRWTFSEERHMNVYDAADTILFYSTTTEAGRSRATSLDHLVEAVELVGPDRVEVRLRRSHLIPESLFTLPMQASRRFATIDYRNADSVADESIDDDDENDIDPGYRNGLFEWRHQGDRVAGFELAARSADRVQGESGTPPKVLFEHTVQRGEEAVELLLAGKLDVIDRLPPWELEKFHGNRDFVTGQYAVPTIHFLVPNMRNPLVASRTFRRALLYGLNRSAMLARLLEKGGRGEVLSAPFIKGAALDDPFGYGYDNSIRPRPYEPKLAIALSLLAFDQARNREPGWEEKVEMPTLVLARPKHDMAEYVALMIRRQWEALGVPVRVVEYREDESIGADETVDFWLVDRVVVEPLVDARRIFGRSGLLRRPSPYMELALEKLHAAEDWPTAGKCLQDIHRLCFEETTVLPLWQMTEHYVHRVGIAGLQGADGLYDLYRNVLRWTVLSR